MNGVQQRASETVRRLVIPNGQLFKEDVVTDFRGVPIEPGQRIAYAGRRGSATLLTEGTVVETSVTGDSLTVRRASNGREVTLTNLSTIAVIQ